MSVSYTHLDVYKRQIMDGMEVLRNLRKEDSETAVLILSARGHLQDKIDGLDSGANDYLCKPFHFEERCV